MPENAGLYQKFDVKRKDGPDRPGAAYFVLDVVNDPFAQQALLAYCLACREALPALASELLDLLNEVGRGEPGPMVQALREPRKGERGQGQAG